MTASVRHEHDRLGISHDAARRRLVEHGPNALPEPPPEHMLRRLARQFRSPLIYLLLFALAVDLGLWVHHGAVGWPVEALAIAVILVLNAVLGAYQESKAEAALATLKALTKPFAWVVRGGVLMQVPGAELVPGDLVRIEAGDRVPADGRLVRGSGLMVDESILTGESLPVAKETGDALSSGTLLVVGKGYLDVTATGPRSAMGRLATMIGGIVAGQTPLERRLATFGNQVALAVFALGVALVAGGLVAEGPSQLAHIVVFSAALAVAAVPEGLPAVMTLALALGVERLAGGKAIVRRLAAVEALGSVTVIATDKTGTLTENRMHVRALQSSDEQRALRAMVLANDAEIGTRAGDPLELALIDYANDRGLGARATIAARPRVASRPFDSTARFMSVTVVEDGRQVSYLKGAPEVLIARSRLGADEKAAWEEVALTKAAQGFRVLALAWSADGPDADTTFLGLVMLWDPPRPEVASALATAAAAGVGVVMITGDHPATAKAVAEAIGLPQPRVVTGAELDTCDAAGFAAAVAANNVFARVTPEHKLAIVEALKAQGEVVAVTGDGVNDAPALKRADVGVAMGRRGSDVTREVADIVLMDDNFATIVRAIEEGRSIYENIQKSIRFLFSTNLALILLVVFGLGMAYLTGLREPQGGSFLLPLTAVQLLWINVVSDGPPGLALALDRNPGVMRRPPRPAASPLLDAPSLQFIVVTGVIKAAIGVALFVSLPRQGYSIEATRTALFLFESTAQLMFAYPARWIGAAPLANPMLHVAVWGGVAVQLATVLVPELRTLLDLVPIDMATLLVVAAAVALSWAAAVAAGHWIIPANGDRT